MWSQGETQRIGLGQFGELEPRQAIGCNSKNGSYAVLVRGESTHNTTVASRGKNGRIQKLIISLLYLKFQMVLVHSHS